MSIDQAASIELTNRINEDWSVIENQKLLGPVGLHAPTGASCRDNRSDVHEEMTNAKLPTQAGRAGRSGDDRVPTARGGLPFAG